MAYRLRLIALAFAASSTLGTATAQPVDIPVPAATTTEFPAGVSVAQVPGGQVYVDAKGRTLYGMDMRTVTRWSVDTSKYCVEGRCEGWEPLLAPADAKPNLVLFRGFRSRASAPAPAPAAATPARSGAATPVDPDSPERRQQLAASFGFGAAPPGMYTQQKAPDWTIIEGPAGPQWVYKGYNMVYVRKDDPPHSTKYDGAEERTWNTLKYIPPVPELKAPNGVGTTWVDDAYLLTDKDGKLLYTGECGSACSEWTPLAAAMVSYGLDDWTVDRSVARPQWRYRGKPVYVAADDTKGSLPDNSIALRP